MDEPELATVGQGVSGLMADLDTTEMVVYKTACEFIMVAESIGVKRRQILWQHILPNVLPAMLSISFLSAGIVMVVEGGLSILGAGATPGSSWGSLLARNRSDVALTPHTTFIPVVAITLTVMALNYFGDYTRTKIDSRESRI